MQTAAAEAASRGSRRHTGLRLLVSAWLAAGLACAAAAAERLADLVLLGGNPVTMDDARAAIPVPRRDQPLLARFAGALPGLCGLRIGASSNGASQSARILRWSSTIEAYFDSPARFFVSQGSCFTSKS
jgi:hypothetical protein